jgi:LPXTG-site transpeptidase (sortase) family protein
MKLSARKFSLFFSSALIAAGLVVCGAYYLNQPSRAAGLRSFPKSTPVSTNKLERVSGSPTQISIPAANISLPVIKGYYYPSTKDWTLTLDKAQFATPSTEPNNVEGNTFIYGHARTNVFYHLNRLKAGDMVTVTTDSGYKFEYIFISTYATKPTDTSVFTYQGPPMLTLQTCSGSFWQNRQMYLFSFVSYEKA